MRIAYHYSLFDNYRLILYYQAVKNYALKLDNRAAGELEGARPASNWITAVERLDKSRLSVTAF